MISSNGQTKWVKRYCSGAGRERGRRGQGWFQNKRDEEQEEGPTSHLLLHQSQWTLSFCSTTGRNLSGHVGRPNGLLAILLNPHSGGRWEGGGGKDRMAEKKGEQKATAEQTERREELKWNNRDFIYFLPHDNNIFVPLCGLIPKQMWRRTAGLAPAAVSVWWAACCCVLGTWSMWISTCMVGQLSQRTVTALSQHVYWLLILNQTINCTTCVWKKTCIINHCWVSSECD